VALTVFKTVAACVIVGRLSSTLRRFRQAPFRPFRAAPVRVQRCFDITIEWQGRDVFSISTNGRVPDSV
jgi:hypothetical protein